MKKLFIVALLLCSVTAFSQIPTDTATLRQKINTWLVPNGTKSITALQINQLFNGVASLMKAYGVDSGYRVADTLFLTRRGGFTTIKITLNSGGAATETDPTVPAIAKSLNSGDTARWNGKQDALTSGTGISIIANVITAGNTTAQWNANKLQGNNISSTNPVAGQVLKWNGSQWEPADESGTGSSPTNLNNMGSGFRLAVAPDSIKSLIISGTWLSMDTVGTPGELRMIVEPVFGWGLLENLSTGALYVDSSKVSSLKALKDTAALLHSDIATKLNSSDTFNLTKNFANSDLTLTSSRTHTGNSNNITFTGFPQFNILNSYVGIGVNGSSSYSLRTRGVPTRVSSLQIDSQGVFSGNPAGISLYGRNATATANNYTAGILEYSFVTAQLNWKAYIGVQSWGYVTAAQPVNSGGKFANYIDAYSAGQTYDGNNTTLQTALGYFSSINNQNGTIQNAYDFFSSDINSVGATTNNDTVQNHYAFYVEPFVYSTGGTKNYGIYVDGLQPNYFGGKMWIGSKTDTTSKLTVTGTGKFTDTLKAKTVGTSDSSTIVATTAWVKQQGYGTGGGAGGAANLGPSPGPTSFVVTNSNGTGVTIPLADTTSGNAGLVTGNERKLFYQNSYIVNSESGTNADSLGIQTDISTLTLRQIHLTAFNNKLSILSNHTSTALNFSFKLNPANIDTVGTIAAGTWQGTIISPQYGGTGINNGSKTLTLSGNAIIGSSTHTVAFATSGNTSVTLPTSGTLLSNGDTTNKWVSDLRRRSGTDSVEKYKNGSWQFAYKDSVGTGSGGVSDGDKGDVIVSNSGATYTLDKYVPKILYSDSTGAVANYDINFTNVDNGINGFPYDRIEILITARPATDNVDAFARFSNDGGSTFNSGASDYEWTTEWKISGAGSGTQGINAQTSDSKISLVQNMGNTSGYSTNGKLVIYNPFNSSFQPLYEGQFIANSNSSGNIIKAECGGRRKTSQKTDAVRLYCSSGNWASIKVKVIGYIAR